MDEHFKPGLYKHYKGGYYSALSLVTHHHTRLPMVLYVSLTYGGINARPLWGYPGDEDGWNGTVEVDGQTVPRFMYVGELPSDIPAENRG